MMILSKSHFWAILFASTFVFASCTKGDEAISSLFQTGVIITNEGPFGSGTGTVSYYDRDADVVKNDIYGGANGGAALGNVLQSMYLYNGSMYLIANNANKLTVVDGKTFTSQSSLATGMTLPRYFLPVDATHAYITQWGQDSATSGIAVYDFTTQTIARTIATGKGANRMLRVGSGALIWVLNSGGLSQDSTITIVDGTSSADTVVQKIQVGLSPNSIVQDANGDMWVLCSGYYNRDGVGKLMKIRNRAVEYSFDVPKYASSLVTDASKTTLYFLGDNKIYTKDILNFGANTPSVFTAPTGAQYLYSLGYDTRTSLLYCGDALDFKKSGSVYIIDPTTKVVKKTLSVGIAPNGFWFQ